MNFNYFTIVTVKGNDYRKMKLKLKCEIETEKHKCYWYKIPIFSEDVDIDNVLVSDTMFSWGKNYKYFIGYLCNDYKINPLRHYT